jgi:hypothetical protein
LVKEVSVRNRALRFAITLSLVAVIGCVNASLPVKSFSRQEDAGTVHVAVQSIAPFDEDYITQLQPVLQLTDEQLANAIAQTRIQEIQRLRALLVEAGFLLPSATLTSTKTTTDGTTSQTTTEQTTPPAADKIPSSVAEIAMGGSPFEIADKGVKSDVSNTLRNVVALRQEVALLNRQVRDAAVSRGTRPYVVRFLVTLNPFARREPYNAYATISLFTSTPETFIPSMFRDTGTACTQCQACDKCTDGGCEACHACVRCARDTAPVSESSLNKLLKSVGSVECGKPLEVIPLFVTDNLESSFDSISLQSTTSLGGGIGGTVQNVAAQVRSRFQADNRNRALARSFNALFTIARLSRGTVEARLGAFTSGTDFEMVPRTYNVTVLALAPTLQGAIERATNLEQSLRDVADAPLSRMASAELLACRDVTFTSLYRFTDGRTGKTLLFTNGAAAAAERLRASWNLPPTADLTPLIAYAQYDAYDDYIAALPLSNLGRNDLTTAPRKEARDMFWLDLIDVARTSGRSYGRFNIPVYLFELFPQSANGTVLDDGQTATLTIAGSRNLSSSAVLAHLEVDRVHTLQSSAINVSGDGRRAAITFPSPRKVLGKAPQHVRAVVERASGRNAFETQIPHRWEAATDTVSPRLSYLDISKAPAPEKEKLGITMSVTADHIVITDESGAAGTIAVAFQNADPTKPKNVRFEIVGAYVASTSPETTVNGPDRVASANGTYVLTLRNLRLGSKVSVRSYAVTEKGARGDLIDQRTIDVVSKPRRTPAVGATPTAN